MGDQQIETADLKQLQNREPSRQMLVGKASECQRHFIRRERREESGHQKSLSRYIKGSRNVIWIYEGVGDKDIVLERREAAQSLNPWSWNRSEQWKSPRRKHACGWLKGKIEL